MFTRTFASIVLVEDHAIDTLRSRSSGQKLLLIAVTGYGQFEDRERSKNAGSIVLIVARHRLAPYGHVDP
jgi:hypothetical protein